MSWSAAYVGLPESECHCWELVRRVYAAELGIELPRYEGTVLSAGERREVEALMAGEAANHDWRALDIASRAQPFDVLVFTRGGIRSHVGLAVSNHAMLHVAGSARIERFRKEPWDIRFAGLYRHLQSPFEGERK